LARNACHAAVTLAWHHAVIGDRCGPPAMRCQMKFSHTLLAGLLTAGFATGAHAQAKLVKIDGSSTVFPVTEAVAEDFQKAQKGAVNVTVGISGTGGGFQTLRRGETDAQDASRRIPAKAMPGC